MTKLSEALIAPLLFSLALGLGGLGFQLVSETLRAILYFSPILAAFHILFLPRGCEEEAELVLIRAGGTEHAMQIQISGESQLGFRSAPAKVDCFLVAEKSNSSPTVISEKEISTDDLAENLWNGLFGAYSRWHYDEH